MAISFTSSGNLGQTVISKVLLKVTFRTIEPKPRDSTCWKLMLQHKHFLLSDLRWIIGNGQDVHILDDVWIPGMDSTLPFMPTSTINLSTVKDLILHMDRGNEWKRQIIHQLWPPDVAAKITVLPLGRSDISCRGSHPAGSCPFKAICQILQP